MTGESRLGLHRHRGVPVLSLYGDLDLFASQQLRQPARDLVDRALTAPVTNNPSGEGTASPADGRATTCAETSPTNLDPIRPDVLVIDVSAVPFTDSAGLGTLVALLQRARTHQAGVAVAGAGPDLEKVMTLMGLSRVIILSSSVDEAVRAVLGETPPGTSQAAGALKGS